MVNQPLYPITPVACAACGPWRKVVRGGRLVPPALQRSNHGRCNADGAQPNPTAAMHAELLALRSGSAVRRMAVRNNEMDLLDILRNSSSLTKDGQSRRVWRRGARLGRERNRRDLQKYAWPFLTLDRKNWRSQHSRSCNANGGLLVNDTRDILPGRRFRSVQHDAQISGPADGPVGA
jgi:hypothetical protein